ncbi:pheromone A receptor-domain-containing protein [Fomitopsis serialis]|uniref:pheromone A receptor-domain-containing protein n=1 Tax=Fomitopsis serialis TaxID=139415 RepID=UPI002007E184|nr:pheromone A receptor-domain-containing protein [Neoantrodia serialis]KAH9911222.1 pheromone A receptor-domain-containing protein [Neoantrodia serialis]
MAADPTYPLYPVISFLGFVLALIPVPWHLQSWNSGTCYYMIWTALGCLNQFVNSVVWANTALNVAPIWCEISIRITIGASVGIPAASMCINRRLYKIARVHAVAVTRAEKRRAILIDSLICVLFPLICIALAYVVQGHRFDVFEVLGCYPAIYNTIPAYPLVYMWPVAIGMVSAVYCVLSLRALFARQAQFREFISATSGLTSGRYFRLMALSITELLFTVPFGIYEIYSNAGGNVQPWLGWANTHYNYSRVGQYPAILWMSEPSTAIPVQLTRWIVPICAFVFFGFFGFAEEARRRYYFLYAAAGRQLQSLRMLHVRRHQEKMIHGAVLDKSFDADDTLPVYTPHVVSPGWRSLASVTVAASDASSSPLDSAFSDKSFADDFVSHHEKP